MHSKYQVRVDGELIYEGQEADARSVYEDYTELVDTPSSEFTKSRITLLCDGVEIDAHCGGEQSCSPVIY